MVDRELLNAIGNLFDEKFQAIDDRFQAIDDRFQQMDERFDQIGDELSEIKRRVSSIELSLENETNRNIRIVAEGHMDLSRNLHSVLQTNSDMEIYKMRLNYLEMEVNKLKEKLA